MMCESGNEYVMKYFDKELNDIEIVKLKQHLKVCTECSNEFNELSEIFGILEEDEKLEPPENFENQVMAKIKSLNDERRKMADVFMITGYGIVSAMLLSAAAMLVGYFQNISFLEVIGKTIGVFNSIAKVLQVISQSQAGGMLYGFIVVAFAIMLCYTGIIIFMDNSTGGAENEAKK